MIFIDVPVFKSFSIRKKSLHFVCLYHGPVAHYFFIFQRDTMKISMVNVLDTITFSFYTLGTPSPLYSLYSQNLHPLPL